MDAAKKEKRGPPTKKDQTIAEEFGVWRRSTIARGSAGLAAGTSAPPNSPGFDKVIATVYTNNKMRKTAHTNNCFQTGGAMIS